MTRSRLLRVLDRNEGAVVTDPETVVDAGWESILLDAFALVHGDRGDTYGPPWEDYDRTAAIYNAITGIELSTPEALLFMVSMKLSRIAHALEQDFPPEMYRDSITDTCGYLDCLWGALNRTDLEVDE